MKKIIPVVTALIILFSGCANINITIGGNNKSKAKDYDVDSIKIVRVSGTLYYDTGEDTDDLYGGSNTMYGNAGGSLKKTAGKYEIPQGDNESNFYCERDFRLGRFEDTLEIYDGDDDDWEIFKKLICDTQVLSYKYCYVLEGETNNTDQDILVLANSRDITFDEAYNSCVGSVNVKKDMFVMFLND